MEYKGYKAEVNYDYDDNIFYGRVLGIRHMISFEGDSVKKLERDFKAAVDSYLSFCKKEKVEPETPFSGNIILRMPSELHQQLAIKALKKNKSLNSLIINELSQRH